jgi:hypothetical protein
MRSTVAFGRLEQIHLEPELDVGRPFSVRMRPGHSSRNEPNQPAQRQQKFRSDRFACFERSSFCWKATSPCLSEAALWKS